MIERYLIKSALEKWASVVLKGVYFDGACMVVMSFYLVIHLGVFFVEDIDDRAVLAILQLKLCTVVHFYICTVVKDSAVDADALHVFVLA